MQEGMNWLSTEETVEQVLILPMLTNKIFYWVQKIVVHKGENARSWPKKKKKKCSPSFICTRDEQSRIVLVCVVTTLLNLLYVALFL